MSTIPRNSDNQPVSSFDEIKAKYGLNKGKETPTKETEKKTTEEPKANANAEATTEIKTTQGKSLVDQSLNKAGITDTKIKQVREEITQEKNDAKKAERLEQKYQEISNKVDARMQTIAKAIPYINSSELNKGDGYNIKGNVVSANAMGGVRYNDEQAPNKREELFQDLMGLNQRIPNDIEVPGKETISAKVADSANIDLTKGAKNAQEAITALQDSVNALIEHTTNNNPKVQIRITRANYDQTLIGAEQAKNLLSAVMEKTGKPANQIKLADIGTLTPSELKNALFLPKRIIPGGNPRGEAPIAIPESTLILSTALNENGIKLAADPEYPPITKERGQELIEKNRTQENQGSGWDRRDKHL